MLLMIDKLLHSWTDSLSTQPISVVLIQRNSLSSQREKILIPEVVLLWKQNHN